MLKTFVLSFFLTFTAAAEDSTFKISVYSFPRNLEPQLQTTSVSYLFQNIYRNLFIYTDQNTLVPDLASSCSRNKTKTVLTCKLKKDIKWSNGLPIKAQDFIDTYKRILKPENKYLKPDLLFPIKNAKEIYLGQKDITTLGIKAVSDGELEFTFEKPDHEFEYNLSTFFLSPTKGPTEIKDKAQFITNGPYRPKSWDYGKSFTIESNPHYPGHPRPDVQFVAVPEDSVTLRLYEKNELSIVRRLPTLLIPKYKDRQDFISLPVLRFDYLGLSGNLSLDLRKKIAHSLNYPEWQKLMFSKGQPGCMGLPKEWFNEPKPCLELKKIPATDSPAGPLRFHYSTQGGDDHRRTSEWLQNQWKTNAGLNFQVRGIENKTFVAELKNNPPDVFRKGLAPDRPTCSGILENFTSGHPENYIKNQSPVFDKLVEDLRQSSSKKRQTELCRKGFDWLMDQYLLIPTGSYDFSILISPKFKGWKLNQLNQLDLKDLRPNN